MTQSTALKRSKREGARQFTRVLLGLPHMAAPSQKLPTQRARRRGRATIVRLSRSMAAKSATLRLRLVARKRVLVEAVAVKDVAAEQGLLGGWGQKDAM
eukprot:7934754-Pyramimonas_sp.AAC.1